MTDETQVGDELPPVAEPDEDPRLYPASFVATAGSQLNDVLHFRELEEPVKLSAEPANGLVLEDGHIRGTAPAEGASATIDVAFEDSSEPPVTGTQTITVTGV